MLARLIYRPHLSQEWWQATKTEFSAIDHRDKLDLVASPLEGSL